MLTIENLTVQYKNRSEPALSSVNLQAKEGELIVFAGPSGSGKSTLAQAILGLIPRFVNAEMQGKIFLDKKSLLKATRLDLISKVGYIPQYPSDFITTLLVEEEIAFPMENLAVEQKKIERRLKEVMNTLDIQQLRQRIIPEISSGEIQRVELASAIVNQPKMIVLDEPMARIDPRSEMEIARKLKKLAEEGHLVLVFEHRVDYFLRYADRIIILEKGKITCDDRPEKAINQLTEIDLPEINRLFKNKKGSFPLSVEEASILLINELKKKDYKTEDKNKINKSLSDEQKNGSYLSLQNLAYKYSSSQNYVLKDINYQFKRGKIYGLLGKNGSGKSTLLRLIIGSLKANEGKITLEDKTIKKIRQTKKNMVYVPENAKLFLTGPTPLDDLKRETNKIDEKIVQLTEYGFAHLLHYPLYKMSEGERRLMAIFIAFQSSEPIVLLDEPTIGLDSKGRSLLAECFSKARKENKLVLIASNDQRLFPDFEEIIVLEKESIKISGCAKEVLYQIEEKSELIANQTVRVIQKAEKKIGHALPKFITPQQVQEFLSKQGD